MKNNQTVKILRVIKEMDRLEKCTNEELVIEALNDSVSDSLIVMELMDRVDPNWAIKEEVRQQKSKEVIDKKEKAVCEISWDNNV